MGKKGSSKFISQADFARELNISRAAVRKLVVLGKIKVRTRNGKQVLNREEAHAAYQATTVRHVRPDLGESTPPPAEQKGKPAPPSYAQSRAAREMIQAHMASLELDKRMGKLVEVEKVRLLWFDISRTLRNSYQALPDRIAPILASTTDPDEVHKILTEEIGKILENLVHGAKF